MDMLPTVGPGEPIEQPVMGEPPKIIDRDVPDVPNERAALVKEWLDRIAKAKAHWKPKFDQMRKDMKFVRGKQWDGGAPDAYVCNVTLRHIQQRTSAVYAKNPTFTAKRKPRLDFQIWSGAPEELQAAQMGLPDPQSAVALLMDVQQGVQHRQMVAKIGKTLEVLFGHAIAEQNLKVEMKQLVRRVKTLSAGYVELGYQRVQEFSDSLQSQINDDRHRLAELERLAADVADGEIFEGQAQMEALRLGLKSLQESPDILVREGLTFDFLRVPQLIVDPACTQLKGFRDAEWLAREYVYKPERIRAIWKRDVASGTESANEGIAAKDDKGCCRVYVVYDLRLKMKLVVCEGYPDFLEEPGEPKVWMEQGHPFFALTFNDVEDDEDPFPPSDVELIRHGQVEINRASEARREHRIAARPAYVGAKGAFSTEDKQKLRDHEAFEFIELDALTVQDDRKIQDKLMAKPVPGIDIAVYETDTMYNDILRSTGDQEANMGPTSGNTVIEATIAENSRVTSLTSEIDDIDEFLSAIARGASQILLREMSEQTAKKIAGPGAVWPGLPVTREDIASEVYLEIKAGSSGRPNRSLKIANKERLAPFILQIPGVNPHWWFKSLAMELDEDEDLEEAFTAGAPSITAMNGMAAPGTGNPATDPNAQGGQGGANAPAAPGTEQGPQPEMPAPMDMPRRMGGSGVV